MKKTLLLLVTAFICSMSVYSQSVATIGTAITMSNDFAHAKKMLTNDGLIYDTNGSTSSIAIFKNKPSAYADEVLIVEIYRMEGNNKIEKCVITFGQKFLNSLYRDLKNFGYSNAGAYGLSIEPFRELYEKGEIAAGLKINSKGWLEATFFRYGQGIKF